MKVFIIALTLLTIGCSQEDVHITAVIKKDNVFTFYRNSILDASMRIHVATFDSIEGGRMNPDYNRAACEETTALYRKMDTQKKHWWCEKGLYKA